MCMSIKDTKPLKCEDLSLSVSSSTTRSRTTSTSSCFNTIQYRGPVCDVLSRKYGGLL